MSKPFAFATTVISCDDDDVCINLAGALCLAWSLRECNNTVSRVLMCDKTIYSKHSKDIFKSRLFDDIVNCVVLKILQLNHFISEKVEKLCIKDFASAKQRADKLSFGRSQDEITWDSLISSSCLCDWCT